MSNLRSALPAFFLTALAITTPLGRVSAQTPGAKPPAEQPAVRYEVSIDGEHFTLDGDRLVKLKSTQKPGTTYEVAVRLAEYQRWLLGNVRFDYHMGFTVSDDRQATTRTATLKHGLGFVMIVTDLGGALTAEQQQKTLKQISQSIQKTIRASGGANVIANAPQQKKMGSSQVRGLTISYDDADSVEHTSLIYLVSGQGFTCSCIVECLEADRDDVMPLIKPTLDSFERGTRNSSERGARN